MRVRLQVRVGLILHADNEAAFSNLSAHFEDQGATIDVRLIPEVGPVESRETSDDQYRWFLSAPKLELVVASLQDHQIGDPPLDLEIIALIRHLRPFVNRCLRAVRNAGVVPSVGEVREPVDASESRRLAANWEVEVENLEGQWTHLLQPLSGFAALFPLDSGKASGLYAPFWADVREAIEDDRLPTPEDEFLINAREHAQSGNFRLAVLESVIALEISVNRYVRAYLRHYRGTPNSRIKKLLRTGLAAKIAGLLDVLFDESTRRAVDIDGALNVVSWRNKITHRGGRLPLGLTTDQILDGLNGVLALTSRIAGLADQATASPDLRSIQETMRQRHALWQLNIWIRPSHRVLVDICVYEASENFPGEEQIRTAIDELRTQLLERDERFDADQHLYVRFLDFTGNVKGRWVAGALNLS